jgi:hypothetical protein
MSLVKGPVLSEWDYAVHVMDPFSMSLEVVDGIEAAYFQQDGALLLFKDAGHTVVQAFRTDLVSRVVRGVELVDADA